MSVVRSRGVLGVDPGTRQTGIAWVVDGKIMWTLTLKATQADPDDRMREIIHDFGDLIAIHLGRTDDPLTIAIEDGIYRARSKAISMLAELRGGIMAESWRMGYEVQRVNVSRWKSRVLLGAPKSIMAKKDKAYVLWYNTTMGTNCETPDEVDAACVALAVDR